LLPLGSALDYFGASAIVKRVAVERLRGIVTVNCALHSSHAYTAMLSTTPVLRTSYERQSGHCAVDSMPQCELLPTAQSS
jgi:hypothetical protein